jgi:adenine-specific DNA methylase
LDHAKEKWIQYYLTKRELDLVREIEEQNLTTLGDVAEVDVGVVTGRNEFFVLTPYEARQHGIETSCFPMIGRSSQIPGLVLTKDDWVKLSESNEKCLLCWEAVIGMH